MKGKYSIKTHLMLSFNIELFKSRMYVLDVKGVDDPKKRCLAFHPAMFSNVTFISVFMLTKVQTSYLSKQFVLPKLFHNEVPRLEICF